MVYKEFLLELERHDTLRFISRCNSARCSVSAVEAVFQIHSGFSDEIIWSNEIPIEYLYAQNRVLRESCFKFKAPEKRIQININNLALRSYAQYTLYSLSEHWI